MQRGLNRRAARRFVGIETTVDAYGLFAANTDRLPPNRGKPPLMARNSSNFANPDERPCEGDEPPTDSQSSAL